MGDKKISVARTLAVLGMVLAMFVVTAGMAFGVTRTVRAARDGADAGTAPDWRPKHTYITRGDFVRWRNPTSRFHDVHATNQGKDWSYHRNLPPGESVRKKFRRTGNYHYVCTVHNGMTGWVHVSS